MRSRLRVHSSTTFDTLYGIPEIDSEFRVPWLTGLEVHHHGSRVLEFYT